MEAGPVGVYGQVVVKRAVVEKSRKHEAARTQHLDMEGNTAWEVIEKRPIVTRFRVQVRKPEELFT